MKLKRPLITTTALLLVFTGTIIPGQQAIAAQDAVKWTRVNIPAEGSGGDWVLAPGSDIRHIVVANDGTLYAVCSGLSYSLFSSVDGGLSWSQTGNVQEEITGIAVSPADGTVYYATRTGVYRSTDSGGTFRLLSEGPGGAGADNIEVTSFDVTWLNDNIIAVGTRDTDTAEFGGIYLLNDTGVIPSWTDTGLSGYDVYAVAFSPGYAHDGQLVAVATDETDTIVTSKFIGRGWGDDIGDAVLNKDNGEHSSVAVAVSAAIAFPYDYDADISSGSCVQFVGIDTGTGEGDVYKTRCNYAPQSSLATDLNAGSVYGLANVDITGISARGNARSASLLAGAADTARTYSSTDGGQTWDVNRKGPTGGSGTIVIALPGSGTAYAATSGDESALSVSHDAGMTWDQISLIDTEIVTIVDLAPSPAYSRDDTLFMLTFGGTDSLWKSTNEGSSWSRILSGGLDNIDSMKLVGLPPGYGDSSHSIFVAGESNGSPAIWKSTDDGRRFRCTVSQDPNTHDPVPVDAWAIVDEDVLFVCSYDGSHGLVYRTTNSGFSYSEGATAGGQALNSIAFSPDYAHDETLLIGNTDGRVFLSVNNGVSFKQLPADAASAPLTGFLDVAFDPGFASNGLVYAVSSTPGKGVYRFKTCLERDWESIDSTLPAGAMLCGLAVTADGAMYAANSRDDGGMERCLNPSSSINPLFETVTSGLGDDATLAGLWQSGNTLWSVDSKNERLMSFEDALTVAPVLTAPDDDAPGTGNLINHSIKNIKLDWESLSGATGYRWQLSCNTDFSSAPGGFDDTVEASSIHLTGLEPATTYYWRVRALAPVVSPWSDKRSFTTAIDTEPVSLRLESPAAGADMIPLKPVFQWTAVAGADAYELIVSPDVEFSNPSIVRMDDYALPGTAWQSELSLANNTAYYWKVRAVSDNTFSAWSATGIFTTEPGDTAPSTPPAPGRNSPETPDPTADSAIFTRLAQRTDNQEASPSPIIVEVPDNREWLFYVVGALLLTIIILLVIILSLVINIRRL